MLREAGKALYAAGGVTTYAKAATMQAAIMSLDGSQDGDHVAERTRVTEIVRWPAGRGVA